ncbi:MBL fold metallo-hydrolase [Mucilaginibacter limnophilus]|uniref:MBL fold metallo-hydrolase n=1 Tax=Mucilaginibacter limnophilus TaxID=1932778 RepID=A0A437MQ84_9SPHI|nr:MBL fold metallo-hydrolase [Mucilaginibacter limnophilus]RVT99797.1 MBL fold metallo-hydrolase [Mucilaginibacter limnophilus]
MKISKYLHSCLLFEQDGYKLLFDPAKFSFAEGRVTADMFTGINAIVITHIHPDHYDAEILKSILTLNNNAVVYTNKQVGGQMDKDGIAYQIVETGDLTLGPFALTAFPLTHEPLLDNPIPEMTGFVINGKVLHPVDALSDEMPQYKGIELLLLVTMAPFTNELKIAAFADKMQPKQILPVHDGYARDFFVKQRYANYKKHFDKQGITFHEILDVGDGIEL